MNHSGFLGVVIGIISLLFAYDGIKHWKIDKMLDMHYKFKEYRNTILKEIDSLNDKESQDVNNSTKLEILYLNLLNELELISLLHQKQYFDDKIVMQMFWTWI
ncbi:MAG: hypothetical protein ACRCTQ_03510 [Brevinemataceae bacterium]